MLDQSSPLLSLAWAIALFLRIGVGWPGARHLRRIFSLFGFASEKKRHRCVWLDMLDLFVVKTCGNIQRTCTPLTRHDTTNSDKLGKLFHSCFARCATRNNRMQAPIGANYDIMSSWRIQQCLLFANQCLVEKQCEATTVFSIQHVVAYMHATDKLEKRFHSCFARWAVRSNRMQAPLVGATFAVGRI